MNNLTLPPVVEPAQLESLLTQDGAPEDLRIVDMCKYTTYAYGHVPGAVHLEYKEIVAAQPPVMGLLPDAEGLAYVTAKIGLMPHMHLVAYDDEGGGKAARLLWTLAALGHKNMSLLNGGIHAWTNEGHPLQQQINTAAATQYPLQNNDAVVASRDFILQHLNDDKTVLLDTRSPEEYSGVKKYSARGGHIPGAVNLDWINLMERQHNLRLKSEESLRAILENHGVTPDKTVVAYCQTNHRSAFVFYVLNNLLQYPVVKAYPGSWSDWGNRSDTPIEQTVVSH